MVNEITWEYKGVAGIYKIINTRNNKCYIGSTVDLYKRANQHYNQLIKNKHVNKYLQASFNKNKDYFKISLEFPIYDKTVCDADIRLIEQYFILKYDALNENNGYNICEEKYKSRKFPTEVVRKIAKKLMKPLIMYNVKTGHVYETERSQNGGAQAVKRRSICNGCFVFRPDSFSIENLKTSFLKLNSRTHVKHKSSTKKKKILNLETGIYYDTAKEAAIANGVNTDVLYKKLKENKIYKNLKCLV